MIINFSHSGNCGDLISSLPFCIAYSKQLGQEKFDFTVVYNAPAYYSKKTLINGNHPCGNTMINKTAADMVIPLLKKQPYINKVFVKDYTKDKIENTFTLDNFRRIQYYPIGSVSLQNAYKELVYLEEPLNDHLPFLYADKVNLTKDSLLVCRSTRYWNKFIDYSFLKDYQGDIYTMGVDDEIAHLSYTMKRNLKRIIIHDFYEAACVINSCKLFIGNQTFFTWMALGLKASPILIETLCSNPNVVVNGKNIHNMYNQDMMEKFTNYYLNK